MTLTGTLIVAGDEARGDLTGAIARLSQRIGEEQGAVAAEVTVRAMMTANRLPAN